VWVSYCATKLQLSSVNTTIDRIEYKLYLQYNNTSSIATITTSISYYSVTPTAANY